jgi:nitrogen fixation protein NifB
MPFYIIRQEMDGGKQMMKQPAALNGLTYTQIDARKKGCTRMISEHPCFGAATKFGKIHLQIASSCNTGCNYCIPNHSHASQSGATVTTAQEAIEQVRAAAKDDRRLRVVEISGPGDPLSNDITFEILRLIQKEFPHYTRCVATNGLLLPKKIGELKKLGVAVLTITVNAIDPEVGSQIYSYVEYGGKTLQGKAAFGVLSKNQLEGLMEAADAGMVVKVNSVYIPGINSAHLVEVAKTVKELGAYVHSIMPLIPNGKFAYIAAPSLQEIQQIRQVCNEYISQFYNCNQCREPCEQYERCETITDTL